jgi:hypothetical protein
MASTLTHTFSTPTLGTKSTISMWIKRSDIGSDGSIFSTYTDSNNRADIRFNSVDKFSFYENIGGSQQYYVATNRLFRDSSAFYHLVCQFDTTQSTASDRIKLWVNGSQETSFSNTAYPTQNQVLRLGSALAHTIGDNSNNTDQFEGYISHIAYVDGSVVAPTTFGETDSTSGIWKFKSPSGVTWGTNGFHLKFENSGALGTDSSGNSNTFTVNGNLKQALDTPSNVYATLNPLDNYFANSTFTNGNNTIATNSSYYTFNTSTLGVSSGKWYCEVKVISTVPSANQNMIGISNTTSTSTTNNLGAGAYSWGYHGNGTVYNNGSASSYGSTYTTNDIIGIALDLDNNKLYFSKNGVYQNSGVPTSGSTGTGALSVTSTSSNGTGNYFIACGDYDNAGGCTLGANFGNGFFGTTAITSAGSNGNGSLFEYDVPSGYYALNTKNINTYG